MQAFARRSALSLILGLAATASVANAAINLGQAKLGNIFLSNETASFPLTCNGDRVEWSAVDFFGNVVRSGSVTPVNRSATITPSLGKRGYFELRLVEKLLGVAISQKTTTLAILTPVDVSTMADSPFGVQTHCAQGSDPRLYDLMARAGIVHFRDEHYWSAIETTSKNFQYPAQFTNFMSYAATAGMQPPLLTMDWSHPSYDYEDGQFTAPHSDAGRAGFADYGADLVRQYPQVKHLEVWNEYNGGTFINGPATQNKPYYYKRMLEAVYNRVKPSRPDVKIVAGGVVPVTHGFLKNVFDQGAMPYLDVVSVHPYRYHVDGVDAEIAELRELIKRYNNGVEKPIWASEFSREVNSAAEQPVAATYLAQIVTLMLTQRVERMFYYVAQDDYIFPFRGLVASPYDEQGAFIPHPTYVAYANLVRQLYGYSFHSRYTGVSHTVQAYRFNKGNTRRSVMWSTGTATVLLSTTSTLTVTDIMGGTRTISPVNGKARLTLTPDAQYVQGNFTAITEESNDTVADSLAGYSATQGQHGWSFGSVNQPTWQAYNPNLFTQMRWDYAGENAVCWLASTWHYVAPDRMHPSLDEWAVRRWTSNTSGTFTISGRVGYGGGAYGNGVNIGIYVDGQLVYSRYLMWYDALDFSVSNVAISVGSKVDFTVNCNGDSGWDSTDFVAKITKQ